MQKIEEKQRHERTAIRVLLNDLKLMAEEKDLVVKEKYKQEIDVSSPPVLPVLIVFLKKMFTD